MENTEEKQVEMWNDIENTEENTEKYGRKASRIVKRIGKYRRKLWKDMKNMDEKYVE